MKSSIPGYTIHPAADLFPMLREEELAHLAVDIAENGQRVPVVMWFDGEGEEVVIDGRNRILACRRAGVEPVTETYRGNDPLGLAIGLNVNRRHLSKSQLAIAAARCMPMYKERAELRMKAGKAPSGSSPEGSDARDEAGRDFNVSGSLVQRAARVLDAGNEELVDLVELGEMTVSAAYNEIKRPGDPEDDAEFDAASEEPENETEGGFEDANTVGESPATTTEPAGEDAPILVDGLEVDLDLSQWFTTVELADRLVEGIGLRPDSVLEPAAGSGALIDALHRRWPDVPVTACEIDARWADKLHDRTPDHVDVRCVDGLKFEGGFHWALLNTPFEDGQDVDFLEHSMRQSTSIAAIIRSNVLQLVSAGERVWSDERWSWDIKLLEGRPRFSGTRGTPRHEFCVVYGRQEREDVERVVTVDWWRR